jgi:peptidoglycan/LPS O-acetylase OafA/YrhL
VFGWSSIAMTGISRGPGLATLVSIQYLRAFAAIMVVYYHIFSNRVAEHWGAGRDIGLSGVDIFFVISGFIMWTSTSHQRGGVAKFLKRRIFRVYPLWWIALTAWITIRLVLPDRLNNAGHLAFLDLLVSAGASLPPRLRRPGLAHSRARVDSAT